MLSVSTQAIFSWKKFSISYILKNLKIIYLSISTWEIFSWKDFCISFIRKDLKLIHFRNKIVPNKISAVPFTRKILLQNSIFLNVFKNSGHTVNISRLQFLSVPDSSDRWSLNVLRLWEVNRRCPAYHIFLISQNVMYLFQHDEMFIPRNMIRLLLKFLFSFRVVFGEEILFVTYIWNAKIQ